MLSERQEALLRVIQSYWEEHGYGPSIRELRDRADISSTSVVTYHLNILERKGLLWRDRNVARSIRLVEPVGKNPKAACSICGQVGVVRPGSDGVWIICPEHGVYFRYELPHQGGVNSVKYHTLLK